MFPGFFRELRTQIGALGHVLRTREFWIYVAIILVLLLIAVAGIRLATGFDPQTRMLLRMGFSCRTGEGQLATIIVGAFVFAIASVFTLGEVIHWVEEKRMSRAPGRQYKVGYWRPILHVVGTIILGISGYSLMLTWCT
jgi:hypothetical protein